LRQIRQPDLDAAAAVIESLREGSGLDCGTRQQNADRSCPCLIETKLNPAVLYSTWCEWHSAGHPRVRSALTTAVKYAQLCSTDSSASVCGIQCAPRAWPPIQLAPDCRREQTVRRLNQTVQPRHPPADKSASVVLFAVVRHQRYRATGSVTESSTTLLTVTSGCQPVAGQESGGRFERINLQSTVLQRRAGRDPGAVLRQGTVAGRLRRHPAPAPQLHHSVRHLFVKKRFPETCRLRRCAHRRVITVFYASPCLSLHRHIVPLWRARCAPTESHQFVSLSLQLFKSSSWCTNTCTQTPPRFNTIPRCCFTSAVGAPHTMLTRWCHCRCSSVKAVRHYRLCGIALTTADGPYLLAVAPAA
jgi:hypothetical protein